MDAFAVAVAAGIAIKPLTKRHVWRMASHFGFFQALMPVVGWGIGSAVHRHIAVVDHWVAFALLSFVGGRMIAEAVRKKEEEVPKDPTKGWGMLLLSIATSIDALAVGLSLAMIGSTIVVPALVIGCVTFSITAVGVVLGRKIGSLWGKRVEILGGVVLIAIGIRIVWAHLTG
jgi:putative Mn2+ efflux pump MntP